MKVAISSTGSSLDARVDPRLGRCECLLFVDPETLEYEAVTNENRSFNGGAGIQAARMIADRGAKVVLTGHCGPNATEALTSAGLRVLTGFTGTVREAMEQYKRGEITPSDPSPAPDVWPITDPLIGFLGRGIGPGRDRETDLARGRGMGRGMGMSSGLRSGPKESAEAMKASFDSDKRAKIAVLEHKLQELLARVTSHEEK